jgi:hypothetical protein
MPSSLYAHLYICILPLIPLSLSIHPLSPSESSGTVCPTDLRRSLRHAPPLPSPTELRASPAGALLRYSTTLAPWPLLGQLTSAPLQSLASATVHSAQGKRPSVECTLGGGVRANQSALDTSQERTQSALGTRHRSRLYLECTQHSTQLRASPRPGPQGPTPTPP